MLQNGLNLVSSLTLLLLLLLESIHCLGQLLIQTRYRHRFLFLNVQIHKCFWLSNRFHGHVLPLFFYFVKVLELQRGFSVVVGEHPCSIEFMIHILQMFGHPVVLQVSLGRQTVIRYRLDGFSILHDEIMNDVIGLTVGFIVSAFVLSFDHRIISAGTWRETRNIDRMCSLIETVLLASEAGSTADVVDLDEHYFITFLVSLVGRFDDGDRNVVLSYSRHIFGYSFVLQLESDFVVGWRVVVC